MGEPRKLLSVDYRTLIKLFELAGFVVSRQKGDHISMTKAGVLRPLVIKTSPRKVPIAHIRTNMTTAGMTREQFFALLDQVS